MDYEKIYLEALEIKRKLKFGANVDIGGLMNLVVMAEILNKIEVPKKTITTKK